MFLTSALKQVYRSSIKNSENIIERNDVRNFFSSKNCRWVLQVSHFFPFCRVMKCGYDVWLNSFSSFCIINRLDLLVLLRTTPTYPFVCRRNSLLYAPPSHLNEDIDRENPPWFFSPATRDSPSAPTAFVIFRERYILLLFPMPKAYFLHLRRERTRHWRILIIWQPK